MSKPPRLPLHTPALVPAVARARSRAPTPIDGGLADALDEAVRSPPASVLRGALAAASARATTAGKPDPASLVPIAFEKPAAPRPRSGTMPPRSLDSSLALPDLGRADAASSGPASSRPLRTPVLGIDLGAPRNPTPPSTPSPFRAGRMVPERLPDSVSYDESCRVRGETLLRTWLTYRLRGHDRRIHSSIPVDVRQRLDANEILAHEWYPIRYHLGLLSSLHRVLGHDEVVATATDSITRGFKRGSWKVFVPVLAELAPETFCAVTARRFALIWKTSFQPGEVTVETTSDSAVLQLQNVPWSTEPAFQSALAGDLVSIPFYACLKGDVRIEPTGRNALRCQLRWRKAR